MAGVSVGAAFCNEIGAEKVKVMGVFGGTFWAPSAGLAVLRKKVPPVAPELPVPEAAPEPPWPESFDEGWLDDVPPTVSATTTATTTSAPTARAHGRRRHWRPAPVPAPSPFMTSARSRRPHSNPVQQ